ncbi:MAG: prolipoprotein diacylglyceryl transferase [Chloroflexi bacterium]|nr:prolipoprotein diacylglyceryl transferase [Chloroflexota bacterium]
MLLATPWFTVFSYSVLVDLAFLVGLGLAALEVRRLGIPRSDALQAGFWALMGAGLGGRILYARLHWIAYDSDRLGLLRFWEGGLAWYGALIGGVAFLALYAWTMRRSFWRYADAAAPALALGSALGCLAHLLNGSAYGAVTDSTLAVNLPDLNGVYMPRYPTQLIEMAVLLALFGLLWGLRRRWPFEGAGFLVYAIVTSAACFIIELLRGDAVMAVGPLRATQVLGGIICLTAIAALVWRQASNFRRQTSSVTFDV